MFQLRTVRVQSVQEESVRVQCVHVVLLSAYIDFVYTWMVYYAYFYWMVVLLVGLFLHDTNYTDITYNTRSSSVDFNRSRYPTS